MSDSPVSQLGDSYEGFVRALEGRPAGMSPLMWMASVANRPAHYSAWMMRWLEEQR